MPGFVVAVIGAGIAFAAWSSTGTGSGTAQARSATNSVIAAGTSAADLYPGATQSVTITVSNPNPYSVLVTSISAGSSTLVNGTCVAGTVTSDAKALDATGLLQTNATKPIAASGSGTYSIITHMTTGAVDACQGQTFSLALTATLTSG
ncbi:MAG: hypothetical protein M3066_12080 [Actinomycetota bacterium]|nr:hypothetical protein [Actinomycetota bacterium]